MRSRIRLVLAVILPLLILVIPALAAPTTAITVCPLGCDYTAIQPAIDAATPGSMILIAAGTYTEQLTLKSSLTLAAQAGPTSTVVTALASPIISGSNLSTVTLEGLGIKGNPLITAPIGIDLVNSSVVVSNVIVSYLHGANGTTVYTNGLAALGLQISGPFSVTMLNSVVEDIKGGDAEIDSVGRGGDAVGISANGAGQFTISSSTVRRLTGGAPGMQGTDCVTCCDGVGGRSVGIDQTGPADLSVEWSTISGLAGGRPCRARYSTYPCPHNAGNATAIQANGGTLAVDHSLITNNRVWASYQNARSAGIVGSNSRRITIKDNEVSALGIVALDRGVAAPASPFCTSGNASMVAISLDANKHVTLEHNRLSDLHGFGTGGEASGIHASNTLQVTTTGNQISNLSGGAAWSPQETLVTAANGIFIDTATQVTLDANRISELHGGQGEVFSYGFNSAGGAAVGMRVNAATQATITNNVVHSIHGGTGANNLPPWPASDVQDGGNATGLRIDDGTSWVQNNTLYDIRGGEHGSPLGTTGQGAGFKLVNLLGAFVINNALISTTLGVSVTASHYLWDYNALWQNTLNYSGVVTGPHDLSANPWLVDPANGDFHLHFNSPLIDAGFTPGAPIHDFDGSPRPLDGNNDGIAQTDIGAVEYQYKPLQRIWLPLILETR